jgi:hypothetical protein
MANPNPSPSTRFKPGAEWRGNAKGRPKKSPLTEYLIELLPATELAGKVLPDGKTALQCAVERWMIDIINGDARARGQALDRVEGRVPVAVQTNELVADQLRKAIELANDPNADDGDEEPESDGSRSLFR